MKFEIVGKNGFEVTEAIKGYAVDKLSKVEKYITSSTDLECRVVCKVYNSGHKVEVTIPNKHMILRSEATESDMYVAIDSSFKKLESQIQKQKTKANKIFQQREGIANFFSEELDVKALSKQIEAQKLVKTKKVKLDAMSVEEAINQMELLGHDFYIYLDKESGKTNLIYLRDDHDYAVIETSF